MRFGLKGLLPGFNYVGGTPITSRGQAGTPACVFRFSGNNNGAFGAPQTKVCATMPNARFRQPFTNQNGAALLVTLLVVTIMTVTVTEFLHSTWLDSSLAAGFRDDARAVAAVRSGVEAARAVIIDDKREDMADSLIVDHLGELWAQSSLPVPIGGTYAFVTITDESGKIDLNRLNEGNMGEKLRPVFKRLLVNLDLDPSISDAIVDWIDKDDDGSWEDGYYQSLEYPYKCKNNKLDSLEELKRVKGITARVFNRLKNYVTIRSTGWVNINTAPVELIQALHEDISPSMAESVVTARDSSYFRTPTEIKNVSGFSDDIYANIGSIIGVYGDTYSVTVIATFNEVTRTARALFTDRSRDSVRLIYFRIT